MGVQILYLDFICCIHSLYIKWIACVKFHAYWKRAPAIAFYSSVVLMWTQKIEIVNVISPTLVVVAANVEQRRHSAHLAMFSNWNGMSEYSFVMKNVNTFSHLQFNLFNVSFLCRMLRFQICITTQTDVLENIFIHQEYFPASLHKLHNLKFMAPKDLCLTRGYYTHCSWNILLYYSCYKDLISLWWCIAFPKGIMPNIFTLVGPMFTE